MSVSDKGNYVLFSTGSTAKTRAWTRAQSNAAQGWGVRDVSNTLLDARRKYEILQYKNNASAVSKKLQYSSVVQGKTGTSSTANTQPSELYPDMLLATSGSISSNNSSSASGVPGGWNITVDADFLRLPLTRHGNPNREYRVQGDKWPYNSPGSSLCINDKPVVSNETYWNELLKIYWTTDIAKCYRVEGYRISIKNYTPFSLDVPGDPLYHDWIIVERGRPAYLPPTFYAGSDDGEYHPWKKSEYTKGTPKTWDATKTIIPGNIISPIGNYISVDCFKNVSKPNFELYSFNSTEFENRGQLDILISQTFGNSWITNRNVTNDKTNSYLFNTCNFIEDLSLNRFSEKGNYVITTMNVKNTELETNQLYYGYYRAQTASYESLTYPTITNVDIAGERNFTYEPVQLPIVSNQYGNYHSTKIIENIGKVYDLSCTYIYTIFPDFDTSFTYVPAGDNPAILNQGSLKITKQRLNNDYNPLAPSSRLIYSDIYPANIGSVDTCYGWLTETIDICGFVYKIDALENVSNPIQFMGIDGNTEKLYIVYTKTSNLPVADTTINYDAQNHSAVYFTYCDICNGLAIGDISITELSNNIYPLVAKTSDIGNKYNFGSYCNIKLNPSISGNSNKLFVTYYDDISECLVLATHLSGGVIEDLSWDFQIVDGNRDISGYNFYDPSLQTIINTESSYNLLISSDNSSIFTTDIEYRLEGSYNLTLGNDDTSIFTCLSSNLTPENSYVMYVSKDNKSIFTEANYAYEQSFNLFIGYDNSNVFGTGVDGSGVLGLLNNEINKNSTIDGDLSSSPLSYYPELHSNKTYKNFNIAALYAVGGATDLSNMYRLILQFDYDIKLQAQPFLFDYIDICGYKFYTNTISMGDVEPIPPNIGGQPPDDIELDKTYRPAAGFGFGPRKVGTTNSYIQWTWGASGDGLQNLNNDIYSVLQIMNDFKGHNLEVTFHSKGDQYIYQAGDIIGGKRGLFYDNDTINGDISNNPTIYKVNYPDLSRAYYNDLSINELYVQGSYIDFSDNYKLLLKMSSNNNSVVNQNTFNNITINNTQFGTTNLGDGDYSGFTNGSTDGIYWGQWIWNAKGNNIIVNDISNTLTYLNNNSNKHTDIFFDPSGSNYLKSIPTSGRIGIDYTNILTSLSGDISAGYPIPRYNNNYKSYKNNNIDKLYFSTIINEHFPYLELSNNYGIYFGFNNNYITDISGIIISSNYSDLNINFNYSLDSASPIGNENVIFSNNGWIWDACLNNSSSYDDISGIFKNIKYLSDNNKDISLSILNNGDKIVTHTNSGNNYSGARLGYYQKDYIDNSGFIITDICGDLSNNPYIYPFNDSSTNSFKDCSFLEFYVQGDHIDLSYEWKLVVKLDGSLAQQDISNIYINDWSNNITYTFGTTDASLGIGSGGTEPRSLYLYDDLSNTTTWIWAGFGDNHINIDICCVIELFNSNKNNIAHKPKPDIPNPFINPLDNWIIGIDPPGNSYNAGYNEIVPSIRGNNGNVGLFNDLQVILNDTSTNIYISYQDTTNKYLNIALNINGGDQKDWWINPTELTVNRREVDYTKSHAIDKNSTGYNTAITITKDTRNIPYPNIMYQTKTITVANLDFIKPTTYYGVPLVNESIYTTRVTPMDILKECCFTARPAGESLAMPVGSPFPPTDFSAESYVGDGIPLSWTKNPISPSPASFDWYWRGDGNKSDTQNPTNFPNGKNEFLGYMIKRSRTIDFKNYTIMADCSGGLYKYTDNRPSNFTIPDNVSISHNIGTLTDDDNPSFLDIDFSNGDYYYYRIYSANLLYNAQYGYDDVFGSQKNILVYSRTYETALGEPYITVGNPIMYLNETFYSHTDGMTYYLSFYSDDDTGSLNIKYIDISFTDPIDPCYNTYYNSFTGTDISRWGMSYDFSGFIKDASYHTFISPNIYSYTPSGQLQSTSWDTSSCKGPVTNSPPFLAQDICYTIDLSNLFLSNYRAGDTYDLSNIIDSSTVWQKNDTSNIDLSNSLGRYYFFSVNATSITEFNDYDLAIFGDNLKFKSYRAFGYILRCKEPIFSTNGHTSQIIEYATDISYYDFSNIDISSNGQYIPAIKIDASALYFNEVYSSFKTIEPYNWNDTEPSGTDLSHNISTLLNDISYGVKYRFNNYLVNDPSWVAHTGQNSYVSCLVDNSFDYFKYKKQENVNPIMYGSGGSNELSKKLQIKWEPYYRTTGDIYGPNDDLSKNANGSDIYSYDISYIRWPKISGELDFSMTNYPLYDLNNITGYDTIINEHTSIYDTSYLIPEDLSNQLALVIFIRSNSIYGESTDWVYTPSYGETSLFGQNWPPQTNEKPSELVNLWGEPTDFSASIYGKIKLHWTKPEFVLGLPIINYEIQYSTFSGEQGPWQEPGYSLINDDYYYIENKTYKLTDICLDQLDNYTIGFDLSINPIYNNSSYYFRIRASNGMGVGPWSYSFKRKDYDGEPTINEASANILSYSIPHSLNNIKGLPINTTSDGKLIRLDLKNYDFDNLISPYNNVYSEFNDNTLTQGSPLSFKIYTVQDLSGINANGWANNSRKYLSYQPHTYGLSGNNEYAIQGWTWNLEKYGPTTDFQLYTYDYNTTKPTGYIDKRNLILGTKSYYSSLWNKPNDMSFIALYNPVTDNCGITYVPFNNNTAQPTDGGLFINLSGDIFRQNYDLSTNTNISNNNQPNSLPYQLFNSFIDNSGLITPYNLLNPNIINNNTISYSWAYQGISGDNNTNPQWNRPSTAFDFSNGDVSTNTIMIPYGSTQFIQEIDINKLGIEIVDPNNGSPINKVTVYIQEGDGPLYLANTDYSFDNSYLDINNINGIEIRNGYAYRLSVKASNSAGYGPYGYTHKTQGNIDVNNIDFSYGVIPYGVPDTPDIQPFVTIGYQPPGYVRGTLEISFNSAVPISPIYGAPFRDGSGNGRPVEGYIIEASGHHGTPLDNNRNNWKKHDWNVISNSVGINDVSFLWLSDIDSSYQFRYKYCNELSQNYTIVDNSSNPSPTTNDISAIIITANPNGDFFYNKFHTFNNNINNDYQFSTIGKKSSNAFYRYNGASTILFSINSNYVGDICNNSTNNLQTIFHIGDASFNSMYLNTGHISDTSYATSLMLNSNTHNIIDNTYKLPIDFSLNKWYNFAITYDTSSIRCYKQIVTTSAEYLDIDIFRSDYNYLLDNTAWKDTSNINNTGNGSNFWGSFYNLATSTNIQFFDGFIKNAKIFQTDLSIVDISQEFHNMSYSLNNPVLKSSWATNGSNAQPDASFTWPNNNYFSPANPFVNVSNYFKYNKQNSIHPFSVHNGPFTAIFSVKWNGDTPYSNGEYPIFSIGSWSKKEYISLYATYYGVTKTAMYLGINVGNNLFGDNGTPFTTAINDNPPDKTVVVSEAFALPASGWFNIAISYNREQFYIYTHRVGNDRYDSLPKSSPHIYNIRSATDHDAKNRNNKSYCDINISQGAAYIGTDISNSNSGKSIFRGYIDHFNVYDMALPHTDISNILQNAPYYLG